MDDKRLLIAVLVASLLVGARSSGEAHGLVGKRFFPATLATDDRFVADELSFPTVFSIKTPASADTPATKQTDINAEIAKRLSPDLGVSVASTWKILDPEGSPTVTGFDNMEVSFKYVFWRSPEHEALLSGGVSWDVGGTGAARIGAESFDTVTPTLLFGKGFGDLPERVEVLRPLALTGFFGVAMPTRRANKTVAVTDGGGVEVQREVNPSVARSGASHSSTTSSTSSRSSVTSASAHRSTA